MAERITDFLLQGATAGGFATLLWVIFQYLRGRSSDAVSAWEKFVAKLEADNNSLRNENVSLRGRVRDLERELVDLRREVDALKARLA